MSMALFSSNLNAKPFVLSAVTITAIVGICGLTFKNDIKEYLRSILHKWKEARRSSRTFHSEDNELLVDAPRGNQNLLNLLYLIAEDQTKREGYAHRIYLNPRWH